MEPQINTLSSTGKWIVELKNNNDNIERVKNKFLKVVPYGILSKVTDYIQENWKVWSFDANTISVQMQQKNVDNAENFIRCISNKTSLYKITNLLELAQKIHGFNYMMKDILSVKSDRETVLKLEQERVKANADTSNGFMKDLAKKTFSELANKIGENEKWKLLCDSFGLDTDNSQTCATPATLFQKWMDSDRRAHVSRLSFEVKQLNMRTICSYIDAIPLEATSSVAMFTIVPEKYMPRRFTKWDLKRISDITIKMEYTFNWKVIAEDLFKYKSAGSKDAEGLWRSGDVLLSAIFEKCGNDRPSIIQFKEEIENGDFELKSPGGITYSQICYLSQAVPKVKFNPAGNPADPFANFAELFGSNSKFSIPAAPKKKEEVKPSLDLDKLKKNLKGLHDFQKIDFSMFLCLYWQDHLGENLDLDSFCHKIIEILKAQWAYDVAEAFEKLFNDIKPFRVHSPELEAFNRSLKQFATDECGDQNVKIYEKNDFTHCINQQINTKETAKKVQSSANNAMEVMDAINPNTCKICMDREINVVPAPCGHYAYCLECIKNENQCGFCKTPIEQKITIYKL